MGCMTRAKLEVNTARLKKLVLLVELVLLEEVSTASRVSTASILLISLLSIIIPKSPTLSASLSPNGYLNPPTSPPPRVSPPPPSQENALMDNTLTLSLITSLDVQFDTPSPSPPIFGHPIPWNLLEAHGDSCLCCIHNRTLIFGLRDELQYMFSNNCPSTILQASPPELY
ncbi:hypothetical protein Tco_1505354 [Tanacetum coccineum]